MNEKTDRVKTVSQMAMEGTTINSIYMTMTEQNGITYRQEA